MLKRSGNFVFGVKIALTLATIFLSTAANTAYAAERNLRVSYSAPATWPRSPAIEPDDIKLILEHLAQTNPKAREIQPAALIYNDLVENVARSGLVERLYK